MNTQSNRTTKTCGGTFAGISRLLGVPALAVGILAGTAQGTEYWVTTTGSDATGDGSAGNPWATISNAVANARTPGDIVTVSNGTYGITAQIDVTVGITVRSYEGGLSGAANTVVERSGGFTRIFNMTAANAVLEGLTIRNGKGPNEYFYGCGVNMTDGLVRDCIIRDNGYMDRQRGAGANMTGGTVSNCIVRSNACEHDGQGGGIRASGNSRILSCRIIENRGGKDVQDNNGDGGGIYVDSGSTVLVRNCLIARNSTGTTTQGGGHGAGVYMNSGTVESCTIVSNILRRSDGGALGGGIYRNGNGTVKNSIICFNKDVATDTTDNYHGLTSANTTYSCTAPNLGGDGNIEADPLFVNPGAGDYRLQYDPVKSPCIDAGDRRFGMPAETDLDGRPRIMHATLDMGAFEYQPTEPVICHAGLSNITERTATVRCNLISVGAGEVALFLFHGPNDGGTNREAWAHAIRLPGPRRVAGFYEITVSHKASDNAMWLYRYCATNSCGASWADSTGGLLMGAVAVRTTRRVATEERPAAFVISRPATATSGPLAVNFTLSGGINGRDFDSIDSPATISDGSAEVSLPVIPMFSFGDSRPRLVTLTIAPGSYRIGERGKATVATRAQ